MKIPKKIMVLVLGGLIVLSSLTGCGSNGEDAQEKDAKQAEQTASMDGFERQFDEMGIAFNDPQAWGPYKDANMDITPMLGDENGFLRGEIVYSFVEDGVLESLMGKAQSVESEEEQMAVMQEYVNAMKKVCAIVAVDRSNQDDESEKEIFGEYQKADKLGQRGGIEYYLLYNEEYDKGGMSEESKKKYDEITGAVEEFKQLVNIFDITTVDDRMGKYDTVEFDSKTVSGESVDSSIFEGHKLTMVNIWGTFCGPCISEMPELQSLYENMKDKEVNVVGIVIDGAENGNEELAIKILKEKGVEFTNIIPDEKLLNGLLSEVTGVPTTIFVDSSGKIVGEAVVGSADEKAYAGEIEKRLK